MATRQETIQTLLELLRPKYDPPGEPDDYGIEMRSKDGTHKVQITHSGVTFTSLTDAARFHAFGFQHLDEIRRLIKNTPSFDVPAVPAAKVQKERVSGPSARGLIFGMLEQHKAAPPADLQEQILKALIVQHPDRDPKKLKSQIYLHRSEWNRNQKA